MRETRERSGAPGGVVGINVVVGMIAATVLAVPFVPVFYVVVMRIAGRRGTSAEVEPAGGQDPEPAPQSA